ncbi:LysE family translocator [Paenibacillus sp. p3-SID867]|uniref:LysE family translocator n=1 Tax=Paenibacillus sp. p3-SID867 TaxID=2916363 RepID=UPI0037C63503
MESHFYFLLVSLIIIITLGLDIVLITKNTIVHTQKGGRQTVLGVVGGWTYFIHATFSFVGITAIIANSLFLFEIIKILGGAYLFYLGIKTTRVNGWYCLLKVYMFIT